ncbi:MAG: LD-carboxypeptidase [Polaribacter sp.]|nr:LD-carboxypeptidase [Polaribacter sp.]MDG1810694.1 LD-carboxypeptidase [Polaribacter sp.]MDG1993278.1 LD-carboxypeptidase [Polaribacter sp.]
MKVTKLFLIAFLSLIISNNQTQAQENTKSELITPPYLQKGDTIAIVAPAGILTDRKDVIDQAKELAESWGLHVVYGKHLFDTAGHFSATDEERAEDFQKAMDNPNIKAIWAGRGGYGTVRILDRLDYSKFIESPKWVIGYSDITALHSHLNTLGYETIHGMMGTSMGDDAEKIVETLKSFKKSLFGEKLSYSLVSVKENRKGTAKGKLIGGNLSLLASMLGSKSQMNADDKILFIEEVGEYKYSMDRMLQSLKRAGFFEKCKGIIVGDISKIKSNTTKWGSSMEQLILDVIAEYDFPVLFNFPAGHEPDNRSLIFGRTIEMNVTKVGISTVVFNE